MRGSMRGQLRASPCICTSDLIPLHLGASPPAHLRRTHAGTAPTAPPRMAPPTAAPTAAAALAPVAAASGRPPMARRWLHGQLQRAP